jgi:ABC-type transporter Mla MlaB component
MATISVTPKQESDDILRAVRQCREQVDSAGRQLTLDLSSLRRIDAQLLTAVEELAEAAEHKNVKVELQGVNIGVYKVLKLMKLAPRFIFLE